MTTRYYTKAQRAQLKSFSGDLWDLATKIEKAVPKNRGTGYQKKDREVALELLRMAAERLYVR